MVTVGDVNPASVVGTLRTSLESLNALSAERASLEEALKVHTGRSSSCQTVQIVSIKVVLPLLR